MKNLLIVSLDNNLIGYKRLADEHNLGFEINDFYSPDVLSNDTETRRIIDNYKNIGLPEYFTMHGAFYDVTVFSNDKDIAEISKKRVIRSMEIAKELGARVVVFHTNINPFLNTDTYMGGAIERTCEFYSELLDDYKDINIYLENMFDDNPQFLKAVSQKLSVHNNYGVCFDYAHASISRTPIAVWISELSDYIKHLHINDNDLRNDLHMTIGHGRINWIEFKYYYKKYFSDCTVLVEMNDVDSQRESVKFIDNLFDDDAQGAMTFEHKVLDAEELLEHIFFYMSELLEVKEFSKTVNLLNDLGSVIVNADRTTFWFWDKKKGQYWTLAAKGNEKIVIDENTGIVGKCFKSGEVVFCNNPYSQEFFNNSVDKETGYVTKSVLCFPVENSEGEVIGVFEALNKYDNYGRDIPFVKEDVSRLSLIAAFCEKTVESYMLHQEAQCDALTGLKNRYAFYEYYNTRVAREAVHKTSLIMCDIDHFKNVNDTYGHNAGDIVLKGVSEILENCATEQNLVVRWGGEEFIIILPGKDIVGACELAERIRKTVEETSFDTGDEVIRVTMSFGVNEIDSAIVIEDNVLLVDEKLYKAKNSGRNRVVA